MLEDVRYTANNNLIDGTRIKSSKNNSPSFKATNPNAVDTTPTADTYAPNGQAIPPEMPFGQKFLNYIFPTWMGLHFGTKAFNSANGGEYEKSLVGRLGKLGDRISETKLIRNTYVQGLKNKGSSLKTRLNSFIDRHETLSAMRDTPTKPECSLVTNFLETQSEADLKEASGKLVDFIEKGPKTLREAGATSAEINALKAKYGTDAFGRIKNLKEALREFQIQKMGFDPATIPAGEPIKNIKLSHLGFSQADIDLIKKNPERYTRELEQALTKAKDVSPKISQYLNKIKSISAPATKLGRFLPKAAKLGMRGLTFGGGLFNSLFVAFFLADAVKNTVDAPKEQKVGTFASGLMDAMSWVIAMPLALKGMHAINGLKNLGKSKAQVNTYENALKTFNQKVKNGLLTDKALYESESAAVDALKNVGTKPKGFKKVLSKVASFLSVGLGQKAAYKESVEGLSTGAKIAAKLRHMKRGLPNFARNCVGYPLRFALYMFAFQPLVDKVFSGAMHAIFGKPYEPEALREEAEKEAQKRAELYPGPRLLPYPEAEKDLGNIDVNSLADDNLVKQELIKRGIVKPNESKLTVNTTNNDAQTKSVNGVQIDVKNGNTPFMPPENGQQNGNPNQINGQGKDPNKADYDNVPRSYMPTIDPNNPIPYHDPMANPNYEKNYDSAQKVMDKSEKLIADTEAFIKNKCRS